MFLWWGDDLVQLYNDAYMPSFGQNGRHPAAMGQKAQECWPEIWDFIYPLIKKVKETGEAVMFEDHLLPIHRNGHLEDVWWTFSYSPVYSDRGKIDGILVICNETTSQQKYIQQIAESCSDFAFAVDAAELGTWNLDMTTGKFTGNERLKEWFGLDPETEIPLNFATERIVEQDRERVLKAINDALRPESGGKYEIEYSISRVNSGELRLVLAKGQAIFSLGNPIRFSGILQDITEKRKAENSVIKARQLSELAIKNVGLGLFTVNFDSDTIEYSPEFAQIMTGNPETRLTMSVFQDHIHPDHREIHEKAFRDALRYGDFDYRTRVIWNDASQHNIAVTGARNVDSKGISTSFSGFIRDVTIQDMHQKALDDAEMRYSKAMRDSATVFKNVTDSSPTGLWLSDMEGSLTYLNKTLVDWTGMRYEDLLGAGWAMAIVDEDRQRSAEAFMQAVANKQHYDVFFRLNRADGKIIWCRAAGDPYHDDDGNYSGYTGFCMDVDEIFESRKAIAESEALFKSIVEQAPVATCLFVGPDMTIRVRILELMG